MEQGDCLQWSRETAHSGAGLMWSRSNVERVRGRDVVEWSGRSYRTGCDDSGR